MSKQQRVWPGWAVVTGASSGFGVIFAEQLAKRGLSLVLAGRDEHRLTAVAQRVGLIRSDIKVELIVGDLGTTSGVDALVAHIEGRPVEVLVNNAGSALTARSRSWTPAASRTWSRSTSTRWCA